VPRLKIALIVDSMYGGGAEKVVLVLRRALEREEHEAHIVALESTGHYDTASEPRLHFLASPIRGRLGQRAYAAQARELRALMDTLEAADSRPFDLILAHLINAQQVVARAQLSRAFYCVHASIEGALRQARRNPLQYLRLRRQQRVLNGKDVIAVSQGLARELGRLPWLHAASVQAIYNPFEFDTVRRLAQATDEPLPDGPYVLHVGRSSRQKRLDVLFAAWREVGTDLPLVLLTNHPDKVRRLARAAGVAERIVAVPFRQNPYPWMAHARLLVLSSDYEGFPLVLIEALACGTPVVSTDCPHGPAEILTGPLAEWLVPVADPSTLATRIQAALAAKIDVHGAPILARLEAQAVARAYAALAGASR
jgi:glycosyltransferase involved in cell wall biosynthesis